MRRCFPALLILLAIVGVFHLPALEIGGYGELGNLDFTRRNGPAFPGDAYRVGIGMYAVQPMSDSIDLEIAYSDDPILRNIGSALMSYTDRFFSVRIGPFFGILNDSGHIVRPGLSTTVDLFVPDVIRFSLRSDTPIGGRLVGTGNYIQERSELSIGFFVPNAMPTFFVRSRRFTSMAQSGETVLEMTSYGIETDVFQSGIPYRVALSAAYQDAAHIVRAGTTTTHRYGALVLGTGIMAELFHTITLTADLEGSIYTFGRDALQGESSDRFLFRLRTGVTYRQPSVAGGAKSAAVGSRSAVPPAGLIRFGRGQL